MQHLLFTSLIFLVILAGCMQPAGSNNKTAQKTTRAYVAGKDYELLNRYRLIDPAGFSEPVEAVSFLIPADWKMEGGIQWQQTRCLSNMVQATLHGYNADKSFEFFMFPVTQFDWSDNPQTLQAMRNGDVGLSCTIAQPEDAAGYIKNNLAALVNGTVVSTEKVTQLENYLQQIATRMNASNNGMGYTTNPSVAEGLLKFPDGSEGLAFCIINQTKATVPDMVFGQGTINTFQTEVTSQIVLKHPAGQAEKARKILSTILTSVRYNPAWATALQTMFTNIKKNIQDESWKRIQISQQAQQEISNNIVRGWEARNSLSESSNASSSFGQYIRGVESWKDESGNNVELSGGYSYAWQRADGSYLLSNTHGFDPNVAFAETWTPLNK